MLQCIEKNINNTKATFIIEPLRLGQGITLGNSLRRGLLSDVSGSAITGIKINNLKHEFKSIPGIHEDFLEIILNLKNLIIKDPFLFTDNSVKQKGFINIKGPSIITASKFKLPNTGLQILNKNSYICTVVDNSSFYCEIDIEKGVGYSFASDTSDDYNNKITNSNIIKVDAIFTPVRKVNFKIRLIHDSFGNLRESLILDLETNGSVTPKRVLNETLKNLLRLFSDIFTTSNLNSLL